MQRPDEVLTCLLKSLASDDAINSRAQYASLIGMCAREGNLAHLKKISEAGAVPYLLALLQQLDSDRTRKYVSECLVVSVCYSTFSPSAQVVLCDKFEVPCSKSCISLYCVYSKEGLPCSCLWCASMVIVLLSVRYQGKHSTDSNDLLNFHVHLALR